MKDVQKAADESPSRPFHPDGLSTDQSVAQSSGLSAGSSLEPINWTVDLEVALFHAVHEHKPVGIGRHFQMIFIHDKLNSSIKKKISVNDIWSHLGTLYDLQALNDSESVRCPENEFYLPDDIYGDLKEKSFPRLISAGVREEPQCTQDEIAGTDSSSDREAVESKPSNTGSKTARHTNDSTSDRLLGDKFVDSHAKSDNRKRTRHSLGGPVPSNSPVSSSTAVRVSGTPVETSSSTSKRARRI